MSCETLEYITVMPPRFSHTRSRSLSDPISRALLPPEDESPTEREKRLKQEQEAKKVSDSIDEQILKEKAALKKQKNIVKILLLGQSESGKSTTLKRLFPLFLYIMHAYDNV